VSAPPIVAAHNQARLPRVLAARLRALPGVRAVSTARNSTLPTDVGPLFLSAQDLDPAGHPRLRILDGDEAAALRAFDEDDALLVSEPLAYRRGLRRGDAVTLVTRSGPRRFAVAGVYRDYGSDAGAALISRRTYDRHFDDADVSSIAVYAEAGADTTVLLGRVRAALAAEAPDLELLARPSAVLRRATLQVFDQTFEITSVLRLLALLVAVGGIAGSLMALELERVRELGVLRALGFTPRQVSALIAVETALLGLTAGLFAVPLGTALAALLVFVINRRSFGWTMALRLAPDVLATAPALGLLAGLLGGIVPALLMARVSPAEALREE
jgi:putative ABC transport system permease protein